MLEAYRHWDRRILNVVGIVLLGAGLLLTFTDNPYDVRWYAMQAFGWLALALANPGTSSFGRAV